MTQEPRNRAERRAKERADKAEKRRGQRAYDRTQRGKKG